MLAEISPHKIILIRRVGGGSLPSCTRRPSVEFKSQAVEADGWEWNSCRPAGRWPVASSELLSLPESFLIHQQNADARATCLPGCLENERS